MDPRERIVTRIPLDGVWTGEGRMDAVRVRQVGAADVAELLRAGPVRFVRASLAEPLEWMGAADGTRFWEDEVRVRLVDPAQARFALDDYPGEYCYLASEWHAGGWPPIILAECCH